MSPRNFCQLLLLISLSISSTFSSPLSTVAISHVADNILVCALLPSDSIPSQYDLNCTRFPDGATHRYPSRNNPYSAIAAGNGFLCALTTPLSSNTSSMRWWDFAHSAKKNSIPDPKRVYLGPSITSLSAGDSHVCGIIGDSRKLSCWRWPELGIPEGLHPTEIAVGDDFVCGLLASGEIKCFGGDFGVVGHEPSGNFRFIAAGTSHACGISVQGELVCWGYGTPKTTKNVTQVEAMALGSNITCVLHSDVTVHCWGENLAMPEDLINAPFVSIQAHGDSVCGILMSNFSLVCWGSATFRKNHVVFKQVLPGPCALSCPCLPIADSGSLCGNGATVCRPCPSKPIPSPNPSPVVYIRKRSNHKRRRLVFIIVSSISFFVGAVAVGCFIFLKIRQKNRRIHDSGRLRGPTVVRATTLHMSEPCIQGHLNQLFTKRQSATVEEFPINVLLAITDNFSDSHKIGSGSFGSVYHGTLGDGRIVAIKRAQSSASTSTSRAGMASAVDKDSAFFSELALLSRVNHKNLVRLFGYCKEGSERILIYEFMTNGTLHDLLHKSNIELGLPLGSWAARIRVALDAARGIEYLHVYAVPPIIHRDIKSSNILLDEVWVAKVSDFGLSLMNPDTSGLDAQPSAAGTVGYMDPEYYRLQHLTAKSDVYSFGVVLLEILSGRKVIQKYEDSGTPQNVVEFAVPHILADDIQLVLDARIPLPTPNEMEAVAYVGYLAADCVNPEGRYRPTMTEIVNALERALLKISCPCSPSRSSTMQSC